MSGATVLVAGVAGGLAGCGVGELLAIRAERARPRRRDRSPRPAPDGPLGALVAVGRRVGAGIGTRLPVGGDAADRIAAAGLESSIGVADLAAVRGAAVVVGVTVGVALLPVLGTAGLVLATLGGVASLLGPDALIARRTRDRAARMLRELPDVVDLLRIALRGGRSVSEALAAVGAHRPGLLGDELRRAAAEVRVGVPTDRVLVHLRRRCPAEGMPELVAVLLRAHVHGGAAGDALRALAEDLRARRARAAIDRASRAAPRIQLVVALLLVPAAMLLIAAVLVESSV
ncbi:MAG: type II secretion system F family protein [Solirubrobacteraceae bacterium]|nr:type II secretion system F family protein [Solirubrobacteraceae bacterium]